MATAPIANETFNLSPQSEALVKLVSQQRLNEQDKMPFSLNDLQRNLSEFERNAPKEKMGYFPTNAATTAALVAVVHRTAIDATADPVLARQLHQSPSSTKESYPAQEASELGNITRAAYDNSTVNPLKDDIGGFIELNHAKSDLQRHGLTPDNMFPRGVTDEHKRDLLETILDQPLHKQQLAAQGMMQSAYEINQRPIGSPKLTGLETYSMVHIGRNLDKYDDINMSADQNGYGNSKEKFVKDYKATEVANGKVQEVGAPKPTDVQATNNPDNNKFSLREQADHIVDLVQGTGLNRQSHVKFGLNELRDNLDKFVENAPAKYDSNMAMTSALMGEVLRTAVDNSDQPQLAQKLNGDQSKLDPQAEAFKKEMGYIYSHGYNDTIINPMASSGMTYADPNFLKDSLQKNTWHQDHFFHADISKEDRGIMVQTLQELPLHSQQLAGQAMLGAFKDSKSIEKEDLYPSNTTGFIGHRLQQNQSAAIDIQQSHPNPVASIGPTQFPDAQRNAILAMKYESNQNNPDMAIHKEPPHITADYGSGLKNTMRDGINEDIRSIQDQLKGPLRAGDQDKIADKIEALGSAIEVEAKDFSSHLSHADVDNISIDDARTADAYLQTKDTMKHLSDLAGEMPSKDYALEYKVEKAEARAFTQDDVAKRIINKPANEPSVSNNNTNTQTKAPSAPENNKASSGPR